MSAEWEAIREELEALKEQVAALSTGQAKLHENGNDIGEVARLRRSLHRWKLTAMGCLAILYVVGSCFASAQIEGSARARVQAKAKLEEAQKKQRELQQRMRTIVEQRQFREWDKQ